jgi:PEGA domain
MASKLAMLLVLVLLLIGFGASGWSQAAAEYGMAAGAAGAAANKASSAVSGALSKAVKQTEKSPQEAKSTAEAAPNLPAPVATKPLETIMKENKEKLEAKGQEEGAQLKIEYKTVKATVYVDGAVVGYTPFEAKLAPGQHVIELKYFNSMPWRKEVSAKQGETLSLKPVLQFKTYPSVVTLSIEQ